MASPAALGVVTVGPDFLAEYPDGDPVAAEIFATLIRAGEAVNVEVERAMLATFDAPQTVLNALAVIDGAESPLTPSQIGERVLVSSATTTSALDALEYRGWVRRVPNPDDRRSVLVEITPDGIAVANQLLPGIRRVERAVLADLSTEERMQFKVLLGKVLARAAEVAASPPIPLEGRRNRPSRLA